jgi:hypothetical protein
MKPNQVFWGAWNADKEGCKASGLYVSNIGGEWLVTLATPTEEIPGYDVVIDQPKPSNLPTIDTSGLLAHQLDWARQLYGAVKRYGAALDASETGTGKTYVSLAVARALGKKAMAVCPKAVKPSWRDAGELLGVELHAVESWGKVRYGNTPHGTWTGKAKFQWTLPKDVMLILDEAHVCKNSTSKNGKMMKASHGIQTIALSASIAENPLDMGNVGLLLGLHDGTYKGFRSFCYGHGCIDGKFGLIFVGGPRSMQRIHKHIFPERAARVKKDTIPNFPETQIIPELVDVGRASVSRINDLYHGISTLEGKQDGDSLRAVVRARMEIERLKIPALAEIAQGLIAEGHSVPIFVSFRESVSSLAATLKTDCIVQGDQSEKVREANIRAFQSNKSNVIILNIQSGGTGISLHDVHGGHPRVSLICPSYDARLVLQALGRVNRTGGRTKSIQKIIYADGVHVEIESRKAIRGKITRLESLNDGDRKDILI